MAPPPARRLAHARRDIVLVLAFLLAACAPKENASREIVIGEYGSLTGPEATFGQSTHNGITLALEEINGAGGASGRKIRLITGTVIPSSRACTAIGATSL